MRTYGEEFYNKPTAMKTEYEYSGRSKQEWNKLIDFCMKRLKGAMWRGDKRWTARWCKWADYYCKLLEWENELH